MIDEQDLRRLLRDAGDAVPPPGRAPEELVARLTRPTAPPRPGAGRERSMAGLKLLGAVAAVVVLIAGLSTLGGSRDDSASTVGGRTSDSDEAGNAGPPQATVLDEGGGTFDPQNGAEEIVPKASPPADGAKIVKTGSIEIEVARGRFERTVDLITTKTVGLGGFVAGSSTSESSAQPSGSLKVRVPVDSYEELLGDVRDLGQVGSVTSKGTDVTAQFADLDARLKALVATRDRLSAVLGEAATVGDILAVQDRITQVQTQIEQIQGQQQVLEDQASFATLAISLGEPGSEVRDEPEPEPEGLGQASDDARRRFGDGIEGIVAWSGPIAIVVILGGIFFVVGRLGWVIVRRFTM